MSWYPRLDDVSRCPIQKLWLVLVYVLYGKSDRSFVEKILRLPYNVWPESVKLHHGIKVWICQISLLLLYVWFKTNCFDFNPTHTWPVRIEFPNKPFVPVENITLHIKYVRALEKGSDCFKVCWNIKKSEAKLCNGVFTGPEIKYLMSLEDFLGTMTETDWSLI